MSLGIAITTYNRAEMVAAQVEALRFRTTCAFDLIVCDDGSSDHTVQLLRQQGAKVVGGVNRGIAWNKNRGLFYLREIVGSKIILLLDDDVIFTKTGWQNDWIEAASRYGHMNFKSARMGTSNKGSNTLDSPDLYHMLAGQCLAFRRDVLAGVGYMDTRFKGYGHEHVDLTKRTIKTGFGGRVENGVVMFYSIEGNLDLLPNKSYWDDNSVNLNGKVALLSDKEHVHRLPWRTEEEYAILIDEMRNI